jgi:citrate lyase subunit beta/citryl-CoA lyase
VSRVSATLARSERDAGLANGSLRLVPWIETARAIVDCHAICTASERVVAVAFGGEDYTADMGIERLDDESNLVYARSSICNAARAAGVLALDTPYFRLRDPDGLAASSVAAKRLGFKGRFAIHPDQIETINACFSPSEAELDEARRIVAAFEAAERAGRGSTSLDGRVIDVPVVKRARAVLAQSGAPE